MTIGAALIFLEISTPFVCTRWLFFHHGGKGSILQAINTMFLAVTFIFGRVCVQAYLLTAFAAEWISNEWFVKEDVRLVYKIILIEMFLAVLTNVALNFYWSFLIIRQVVRLIVGGNKADKTFGGDDDPAVEEESKDQGKQ